MGNITKDYLQQSRIVIPPLYNIQEFQHQATRESCD